MPKNVKIVFHIRYITKSSGKSRIPREQPNQNEEMTIADLVLLSLFIKDNEKCNIAHAR